VIPCSLLQITACLTVTTFDTGEWSGVPGKRREYLSSNRHAAQIGNFRPSSCIRQVF